MDFSASTGTADLHGDHAKAAQTITFGALGNKVYGDPPFTVAATGGASGQPVTFSLHPDSDGCSVTGNTVTIVSATAVDESCIIVASQLGDSNYSAATDVARSFMIAKANPTVTAVGGTFVYNGNPQGGTGTATGVLSESLTPVTLSYTGTGSTSYGPSATAPTNAGAYTVTATFAGNNNYNEATSTAATLTIAKAPSTTTVSCMAGPFTYNGNPQTPCSVTVTGEGGLNETPAPTYTDNVNAGTATASYTYAESTNHLGSSDTETFVIAKAAVDDDGELHGRSVHLQRQPADPVLSDGHRCWWPQRDASADLHRQRECRDGNGQLHVCGECESPGEQRHETFVIAKRPRRRR